MAYLTVNDLESWLEPTKAPVQAVDSAIESNAVEVAFGIVSRSYDTSTWTDDTNTPKLVRKAVAMLYASYYLNRAYSEDGTETDAYADKLEARATALLEGIADGSVDLLEVVGTVGVNSGPSFYPDDATGASQVYDDMGVPVGDVGSEAAKFTMGQVF